MSNRPFAPRPSLSKGERSFKRKLTASAGWPWLKRGFTTLFFVLVGYLMVSQARSVEWGRVLSSLKQYPVAALWGAAALSFSSFLLYSCFDLLGRHYTGHSLKARTVMTLTFVSYAFNLNLGSAVGGIAFRFRLYSRLGLPLGVITRVMSVSMLANWMGYVLLAGLLFSLQPPALPLHWKIDAVQLRLIGLLLMGAASAYLVACALSRQRTLRLRGHAFELPTFQLAGLQIMMGASNWLLMSGIVFVLLQQRIEFFTVASVLLLAAIAGVVTHIPGNLGVLEAVFVALLSHRMAQHELLAGVLAYRVIYYLVPLVIATLLYLVMEAKLKKHPDPAPTKNTASD